MMKKDYADKSWILEDLDAHWHEHEINTYVKIGRLSLITLVLAGILISFILLITKVSEFVFSRIAVVHSWFPVLLALTS